MKQILITFILGTCFALANAKTPLILKDIDQNLTNSNSSLTKEPLMDTEIKPSLSSHLILDKTNSIVRVQVQSSLGKEKIAVGSGSIIRNDGLIVTNYHVISSHFTDPTTTNIVFSIGRDNEEFYATLEAVDLVNDLALIKPKKLTQFKNFIPIEKRPLQQGQKIYSLGFPHNWSMTMIEGIFNGYMDKQSISHYLVSNALSPGMSGGPTFNDDGNLVAVNVAATNKLSILIPVASLNSFLQQYKAESMPYSDNELEKFNMIRQNAIQRYADFSNKLLDNIISSAALNIGEFQLPLKNRLFECWSKREKNEGNLDKIETKNKDALFQSERLCATQDNIFLQSENTIGQIGVGTYYYKNNNASPFSMWKTIEKKYNVISIKNENSTKSENGECFIRNVSNNNKKLQKMQICVAPFKETNRLWKIQISQIHQIGFNEIIILDFLFNGFTEQSINKIIGYTKNI